MRPAALLVGTIAVLVTGCGNKQPAKNTDDIAGNLRILHAGSLSVPFGELSKAFDAKYPCVRIEREAHGTRDCARQVVELGRSCDVFGAADYKVVENLMMPHHADYNIRFATNELSLVYTDKSTYRDRINSENWPEILLRDDVMFGRADPNRDPCGYRTVMVFQLAEKHFDQPGLAKKLSDKHGDKYIRPKETDLLALLESGEIDYLFIYRSVGEQHGLDILRLSDEVNLKSQKFEDLYNTARIKVTGRKPGEFIERSGSAIVYSVTIPRNAENREAAEAYVSFLLSPAGRKIIEKNGQSVIAPARVDHYDKLPESLGQYCVQEPR